MRRVLALVLLCSACDGCEPKVAKPEVELLGHREAELRADGTKIRVFDSSALPRLRFEAPPAPRWQLLLAWHGHDFPLSLARSEIRDGGTLWFTAAPSPEPPLGELMLELRDERGRILKQWQVRWDLLASRRPEFTAVVAMGKMDAPAALAYAMAASDPLICGHAVGMHRTKGELEAAIEASLHCAEVARAAGVVTEQTRYLRNAVFMLQQLRRYREALELIDRAEALDRGAEEKRGLVLSSYYRGVVAWRIADYRMAREALTDAIELGLRDGFDVDAGAARSMLAIWYLEHGLVDRAKEEAERTIEMLKGAPELDLANAQFNLGWIMASGACRTSDSSCLADARRKFEHALEVFMRLKEVDSVAEARLNLAYVAFREGDSSKAGEMLRALDRKPLGAPGTFVTILSAEVALREGRTSEALSYAQTAVAESQAASVEIDYSWRAAHVMGRALAAANEKQRASAEFSRAIEQLEDSVRYSPIREGRAAFFFERRKLYQDAVALLVEQQRFDEALATADRAQSRVLRDLALDLGASRLVGEDRLRFLEQLEVVRRGRDGVEKLKAEEAMRVGAELAALKRERAELEESTARSFDAVLDLFQGDSPAPIGMDAIGARLAADEALVELFDLEDRALFFLLQDRKVHVFDGLEPLLSVLDERVAHVYLVDGREPPRLLPGADRFSVSYLPFASLLAEERSRHGGAPLLVIDPRSDLPSARIEGERVAARFDDPVTLEGDAANRAAVISALATPHALFHCAGHGVLEGTDPWAAHLALAGGTPLTVEDVLLGGARADVIVLSGCETGLALGPERISLASAFLLAGARSVVATHGKIDDVEVRRTMLALYEAGLDQKPAEAVEKVPESWNIFRVYGRR